MSQEEVDARHGACERVLDVVLVGDVVDLGASNQRHDAAAALGPFQSVASLDCLLPPHLN